jgi:hypothetical protein
MANFGVSDMNYEFKPTDRVLSDAFFSRLKNMDLGHVIQRVKQDHTLQFCIRGAESFTVYYRGHELFKFVDSEFLMRMVTENEEVVEKSMTWTQVLQKIPHLKNWFDTHLATVKEANEREFQQLVMRENNHSSIANATECFITDMEYSEVGSDKGRFDMLGLRWLASDRGRGGSIVPLLIEMKYENSALAGKAGLESHLEKYSEYLLCQSNNKDKITNIILKQFNQLHALGLMKSSKDLVDVINIADPEIVFLLANYNPRSAALKGFLEKCKNSKEVVVKYFYPGFAGYAMHDSALISAQDLLEIWKPK